MYVQTADPEGIDGGPPRMAVGGGRPRRRRHRHVERALVPVDFRIQPVDVDRRRDDAVLHGEHRLDEAGDSRRLQRVADVGLHAPDRDLRCRPSAIAEHLGDRLQLGGVSELCRSGVGLDVLQSSGVDAACIGPLDRQDLPFLPRRPKALALPVGRDSQAANHGENGVPVGEGLRQGLDQHRGVPLAEDQAVGIRVEGAGTHGADRLGMAEEHQGVRLVAGRAAHDRHVDAAHLKGPRRKQERLQRRRAGRIDRHERPAQPERLGDRPRRHADGEIAALNIAAGVLSAHGLDRFADDALLVRRRQGAEGVDFAEKLGGLFHAGRVDVVAGHVAPAAIADEDAGIPQRQVERVEPRVPARFRSHFAHRQMRAVRLGGKVVRHRAGLRVKGPPGAERGQLAVGLADRPSSRIVVVLLVEVLRRKLDDCAAALHQQLPEFVQGVGAREPAGHADDGQRSVRLPVRVCHDSVSHGDRPGYLTSSGNRGCRSVCGAISTRA